MLRKTAKICLLVAIIFSTYILTQAQLPRLPWPRNLHVYDDALHWDAVENASGYRISLLGINSRGWIIAEVSQNRYDLRDLRYDYVYYTFVEAISANPAQHQDSVGSTLYHLTRPRPTPTPTSTPTATPSPTSTRVFLRGIGTPQNLRELPGAKVAWDPVAGAVSYSLYIIGGGETHTAGVLAPQTELSLTVLRAGITYRVLVSAHGNGQTYESQGRWSRYIEVTIPAAATSTPTA
ncbi:MAG: hypothetical protein F4Y30_00270 [Chloroflexi bacterium]|nr:hypothetical protein [Chloroflexota bacterium]MYC55156.1 hypothetical protein [Chloroflexota bacterium]MYD39299.1 hypothetical protein [Chloroflexota bacterium]